MTRLASVAASASGRGQNGAAALVVVLMLFLLMAIAVLASNRHLVVEHRSAANELRSNIAFEAAEAGIEWTLAQLNRNAALGDDCLPATDPAAEPFRSRVLRFDAALGSYAPRSWNRSGAAAPVQSACVRGAAGWSCSCPRAADPAVVATPVDSAAFVVQLLASDRPDVLRVVVTGCSGAVGVCTGTAAVDREAVARHEVAVALLPALRTSPVAALTARGAIDIGAATLSAINANPATGIALLAGAAITAPSAIARGPGGASATSVRVEHDDRLASMNGERLFSSLFGLDQARWADQPTVVRLVCSGNCGRSLGDAVAAQGDNAMVWIDGDLSVSGPLVLGSAARPAVIVVRGDATLESAVDLHGVLYARTLRWTRPAAGASVRGALVSQSDYGGDATPEIRYERRILDMLRERSGTFVRVAGSWRDF